jgi:uncharacterized protein YndB with AHSA1/START domain
MTNTDRIEKQIVVRAPRSKVWSALTDATQFGTWFRARLDTDFVVGQRVTGRVTYAGYEHLKFEVMVERMEPEQLFAFRWHPAAIDPAVDYSKEQATLVELRLEEVAGGTRVTVVESGFDQLPPERREVAFRMNSDGWATQLTNLEQHVTR